MHNSLKVASDVRETEASIQTTNTWSGESFARITASNPGSLVKSNQHIEKEWKNTDECTKLVSWTLDIEESIFGIDSNLSGKDRKKGRKGQTLLVSNSSGRRR